MRDFRSFISLIGLSIVGAFSYVCESVYRVIEIAASKFDVCVADAVKQVIAQARAVQRDAKLFVSKASEKSESGCNGFVSLRRSLDASDNFIAA